MIVVSSLWQATETIAAFSIRHAISINDPGSIPPALPEVPESNRLNLEFHDVTEKTPWSTPPTAEHIDSIVTFGRSVVTNGDPILIHCLAGVSRSTAAGLVLGAGLGTTPANDLVRLLREGAPFSQPNPLLVRLGDDYLGLNGSLARTVAAMDTRDPETAPHPFVLNVH